MCEFANSKIPIKQQSLDLFIVKALYFYPLTTNLFQCVHLKIKAEQRSRFPMQLQRGIKPLDAGHITGMVKMVPSVRRRPVEREPRILTACAPKPFTSLEL